MSYLRTSEYFGAGEEVDFDISIGPGYRTKIHFHTLKMLLTIPDLYEGSCFSMTRVQSKVALDQIRNMKERLGLV